MKSKIKNLLNKDIVIYSIMLATVFILSSYFFISDYPSGHDTFFHISVLKAIKESISLGSSNIKILPLIAHGFGYGTGLFYAPFAYFISIVVSLLIPSIYDTMKVVHIITMFLSIISMYFLLKKATKNKLVSLLCSILYISFPYYLSDIFVRDAYAESISFIFIPLIFNGLYELLYLDNPKKFYKYFITGSVLLTITHNITTLYCALFGFIFLLFNIKKLLKEKKIKPIIIALLFIIGMSLFYLVPVGEQKIYGSVNLFNNEYILPAYNALKPFDFLNFGTDEVTFYIPFTLVLLSILSIIKYRSSKVANKQFILYCGMLGLLALFMTTNLFSWDKVPAILSYIQFPWRLLLFADFFLCFFISIGIISYKTAKAKAIIAILVFVTAIISISSQHIAMLSYTKLDYLNISYLGIGYSNDYLPIRVVNNMDYYNNRNSEIIIEAGEGRATINSLVVPTINFDVKVESDAVTVELPLLYYYGYSCNNCQISESPNGFVEATIDKSGNYIVDYTGTNLDAIADFISLSTLIVFIALIIYDKYAII